MTDAFYPRLKVRTDYLAGAAITLAPLVYFFNALRRGLVLSPDDGVIFNVPLRVAAGNLLREGYLPLWNPYIFCGMPLHGASQAGLLFPINWTYVIFSPPTATNLMMLMSYALAGLGAYLYARRSGTDIAGAIVTGLVWQFGAFLIEQIGHTNIVHTAAMLPWVLWSVDGYVATGKRTNGLILALLLALQMFAGHQQTFTYSLLLTAAYAFVMARSSVNPRRSYLRLASLMIAGLALAAVQILPAYELLRNSLRATATYEFFGAFSMPPRFVLTFFAPYVFGGGNGRLFRAPYIERQFLGEYLAYVGILTIMLAVIAFIYKRDTRTKFWGIVFLVALLMAFGRFLPFLYKVIYHVPLLNLFRCSALHLMEVEFSLAVLAGRGLTALRSSRRPSRTTMIASGLVFVLTCLAVTWWRPSDFQLARQAPVTLLRAPELFIPPLMAALSVGAIWALTRYRNSLALVGLIGVLILDLLVYGYGSGWHTHSPGPDHDLWREPATVKFLLSREGRTEGVYRILTEDRAFDPLVPVPQPTPEGWVFSLQPDIYMMHEIENAGGYDGFGLARYSRLAGDMKVWGELTNAERTLRGESRELDILNVRYLLTRSSTGSATTLTSAATRTYQGQRFAENDLSVPAIGAGQSLSFRFAPTEIDRIALMTKLSWSTEIPNGTVVGHVQLRAEDGRAFDFELRAGQHTADWAYDRPDIKARIKHKRAPVATSYVVEDTHGKYQGHTYVCDFTMPSRAVVTSGSITVAAVKAAPELSLTVTGITLGDGERFFPLDQKSVTKYKGTELTDPESDLRHSALSQQRWQKLIQLNDVAIFENKRALPRAWLTTEAQVLTEPEILQVIRTGKLPDGRLWEPRRAALVEAPLDFQLSSMDETGSAEVTNYGANRITVKTNSTTPAILVLSDNHYPGWRAQVDGQAVETLRVDYNLRGVILTPGQHIVEFLYRPKSALIGLVISMLTVVGLALWWKGLVSRR